MQDSNSIKMFIANNYRNTFNNKATKMADLYNHYKSECESPKPMEVFINYVRFEGMWFKCQPEYSSLRKKSDPITNEDFDIPTFEECEKIAHKTPTNLYYLVDKDGKKVIGLRLISENNPEVEWFVNNSNDQLFDYYSIIELDSIQKFVRAPQKHEINAGF